MNGFVAATKPTAKQLAKTPSEHSEKSSSGANSHSENNSIFGPRRSGGPQPMPQVNIRRPGGYMSGSNNTSSSHEPGSSPPGFGYMNHRMGAMQISELKSEKFSAPNSIIKDRFFNSSGHVTGYGYQTQQPRNAAYNGTNRLANYDRELQAQQQNHAALAGAINRNSMHSQFNNNQYNHHPAHHHQNYVQPVINSVAHQPTADAKAMQALQQIQEAKPGNKRAILTDLPEYLYSIPALASFFEPYGEVAMLQILPLKRMWDGDLIDLLGASMCNRLSQNTYCAIVEFYSARMAKFIIGILRKRLPILKFRCALLKPSAAIELTNQADNLALGSAVRLRHIPDQKTKSTDATSSGNGSSSGMHCNGKCDLDTSSASSTGEPAGDKPVLPTPTTSSDGPVDSSTESGLDSGSGSRQITSHHLPSSESSSCSVSGESDVVHASAEADQAQLVNGQRFVASLNIQLK